MIATRIEKSLRRGIYGLFCRNGDPYSSKAWHSGLIRCIEENAEVVGSRCYIPDRFLITLPDTDDLRETDRRSFMYACRDFIEDYMRECDYRMRDDIRLDIVKRGREHGRMIEFYGWVSPHRSHGHRITLKIRPVSAVESESESFIFPQGKEIIIGRGNRADVRLEHPCISECHLQAVFTGRKFVEVKDLNSLNGTYHGGKRFEPIRTYEIMPPFEICCGGVFQIDFALTADGGRPGSSQPETCNV